MWSFPFPQFVPGLENVLNDQKRMEDFLQTEVNDPENFRNESTGLQTFFNLVLYYLAWVFFRLARTWVGPQWNLEPSAGDQGVFLVFDICVNMKTLFSLGQQLVYKVGGKHCENNSFIIRYGVLSLSMYCYSSSPYLKAISLIFFIQFQEGRPGASAPLRAGQWGQRKCRCWCENIQVHQIWQRRWNLKEI